MMTNAGMNPVLAEFTNPGSYIGLHGFNKFGPRLKPVEDLAASGNKWARARVISKAINKGTPSVEPLPNNVGWGPRQSIHVVHDKNSARFPKLYYPERWDAVYEGAPESGNEHSHMPSYLNMRHPKRVWDALTGRYFIYPTAVGTTLIGGANNDNDK